jgi:hypothetical protein
VLVEILDLPEQPVRPDHEEKLGFEDRRVHVETLV